MILTSHQREHMVRLEHSLEAINGLLPCKQ